MKGALHKVKIEHIRVRHAIDYSPHHHAYINPYNGCPMDCPFCYWLDDPEWEGRLQVRDNIVEMLRQELVQWDAKERIYIGSICDPFCDEEIHAGLTRQCLELLKEHKMPVLLTTSATNRVIRDYLSLLIEMREQLTIVVELARPPFMKAMKSGEHHPGIENANLLHQNGIRTWTTYAPIIPGVSDLEGVLNVLDEEIPVYVEELLCKEGTTQVERVKKWVKQDYPEAYVTVREMIETQDYTDYNGLMKKYERNKRILHFPFRI